MKLADLIAKGKRILHEHAGSEGFVYILKTSNRLSQIDNNILKLTDIENENGVYTARLEFKVNRDYGFALNSLKAVLGDINVKSLELVY